MRPPKQAFSLTDASAYAAWRERKLAEQPAGIADLIVELDDPRALTGAEREALLDRCRRSNLAIYVSRAGDDPDKDIPRLLGRQLGLQRLDHNPGADEDAITSLRVRPEPPHTTYIPYTDRPIAWHTDGYYNPPARRIDAFILHCVRPAAVGGENGLIDPELLYLHLRDRDPAHIRALMAPTAMTIPANQFEGADVRPACPGPVFLVGSDGHLAMRYTDRRRNVEWADDPATTAAVAALRSLLDDPALPRFTARLDAGWGVICNNVLHARSGFTDGARPRLLYRARYYERIAGT